MSDTVQPQILVPHAALVVDDDPSSSAAMARVLKDLGVTEVVCAGSVAEGWAAVKAKDFDFVILDWKLPDLSGPVLLHRLRARAGTTETPVLMVSGFFKKSDFRFAEEYLFTSILEKPIEAPILVRRIKDMMKDRWWVAEEQNRFAHLISRIDNGDPESWSSIQTIVAQAPRPAAITLAVARALLNAGAPAAAESLLTWLLDKDPECAVGHTLLGRTLLLQRKHTRSLVHLNRANDLFPRNPERLSLIGDVKLDELAFEDAETNFKLALDLDPQNEHASAGLDISASVSLHVAQLDLSHMPPSFASLLNSLGIHLIKQRRFREGMTHYLTAMNYVEPPELKAKLSFNLGLAHLKANEPDIAVEWFRKSLKFSNGKFTKARSYVDSLTAETDLVWSTDDFGIDEERLDTSPSIPLPAPVQKTTEPPPLSPKMAPEAKKAANPTANVAGAAEAPVADAPKQTPSKGKSAKTPADDGQLKPDDIRGILRELGNLDATLFRSCNADLLRKSHSGYRGKMGRIPVAVFIPKKSMAADLIRPIREALLAQDVHVFIKNNDESYTAIWPLAGSDSKKSA